MHFKVGGALLRELSPGFVGIDLAGKDTRPTGWSLLTDEEVITKLLFLDHEIISETLAARPQVVAIDAPLSLPKHGVLRRADREMHRRGFPVLPPLYPAMKELTLRGQRLAQSLRCLGLEVIEVHPTSTAKVLGLSKEPNSIRSYLGSIRMGGLDELSEHEIDAILAAITAALYAKGQFQQVGDPEEGFIVLPEAIQL